MNRLSRIEKLIEQFIEEPFVRLFSGRVLSQEVARQLAQVLEDGQQQNSDGLSDIPGCYIIAMHPEDLSVLQAELPTIVTELQLELQSIADKIGVRLREPPEINLREDAGLAPQTVYITPVATAPPRINRTQDLDVKQMQQLLAQQAPCAYLIIAGRHTVDLEKTIVRIGRALDNDIILEDRRVSRYHAQLRQRYGRYLLHDLGSTGGTMVNGFRIQETVLHPGDTISLSGVDIIYAEDKPVSRKSNGSTMPMTTLK
ncbi:MAG: DUF3662 domain-containing protein [Anaerolineae bacterium]|nr:DUF3662 domain-containing protein [Anaerolineae bacterium]